MLKIFKPVSDERDGAALLLYLDGNAAVRVIAADDEALLMERVDGARSLGTMAVSGADMAAAEILAETILQSHAPRTAPIPSTLVPPGTGGGGSSGNGHSGGGNGGKPAGAARTVSAVLEPATISPTAAAAPTR